MENAKGDKNELDQVKSMKGVDKNELKKMKKELRDELEEQEAEVDPKLIIKYVNYNHFISSFYFIL